MHRARVPLFVLSHTHTNTMNNTQTQSGPRTLREIIFDDMRKNFLRIEVSNKHDLFALFGDALRPYKETPHCVVGIPVVRNETLPMDLVLLVGSDSCRIVTADTFQQLVGILAPVQDIPVPKEPAYKNPIDIGGDDVVF